MIVINDREAVHITNDETEVDRQLPTPPLPPTPPAPPRAAAKGVEGQPIDVYLRLSYKIYSSSDIIVTVC